MSERTGAMRPAQTATVCPTDVPGWELTLDLLGAGGYDVAGCHAYLDTAPGADCLDRGCAVRRACPVGAALRGEAQSAFHMAAFHGTQSSCDA